MIAEMMAKVHKMHPGSDEGGDNEEDKGEERERESGLWTLMRRFLELAPDGPGGFESEKQREIASKKVGGTMTSKAVLEQEISYMESALSNCSSPIVFCHNDLVSANIIMLKGGEEVRFIDYEYGMDNYAAFDVAMHFNEFVRDGGYRDYEKYYPDKAFQTQWIENYLRQGCQTKLIL
jgi:ethanolamine kinase